MTRRLLLFTLAAAALLTGGCHLFSKKPKQPKESSSIAIETEESLRHRWVDKRVGELTAQGATADAARTQAEAEFRERFGFTQAAQKK